MSLGISKQDIYKLTEIAYKVIKYEKLPKPIEIKFRNPISGVRKTLGICTKIQKCVDETYYSIIVSTIKAKFYPDPTGRFKCLKTGQQVRKATVGEEISLDKIKYTLAHEIAHLKFWLHNTQHKAYTEYILNQINKWWY